MPPSTSVSGFANLDKGIPNFGTDGISSTDGASTVALLSRPYACKCGCKWSLRSQLASRSHRLQKIPSRPFCLSFSCRLLAHSLPTFPPFALFPTICIYSPCPSTASGPPCSKHCRRINHPKKKRVILSFPYSLLQLLLLSQRKRQTRPVLHRVSVYDCHINAPQRVLTLRKGERKR